jgi:hypothetical protein
VARSIVDLEVHLGVGQRPVLEANGLRGAVGMGPVSVRDATVCVVQVVGSALAGIAEASSSPAGTLEVGCGLHRMGSAVEEAGNAAEDSGSSADERGSASVDTEGTAPVEDRRAPRHTLVVGETCCVGAPRDTLVSGEARSVMAPRHMAGKMGVVYTLVAELAAHRTPAWGWGVE